MSLLSALRPTEIERPVLDLSGDGLRAILNLMIAGSEDHGGIERYVDAVKLKSAMFQQALAGNAIDDLEVETFKGLCTFMATVRRRIGNWLNEESFADMRDGLKALFAEDDNVDARIDAFCANAFRTTNSIAGSGTWRPRCCTTRIRNAYRS